MFDQSYLFNYRNNRKPHANDYFQKLHIYTFKSKSNHRYIVNVEEYDYHVMIIKFYLKAHSLSSKKYQYLTNLNDAPRLIRTCTNIMLDILSKNPYSSFGFVAAQSLEEVENNSKRFNVYRILMSSWFSPERFFHKEYKEQNAYLMLNKNYGEADMLLKVEAFFKEIYPSLDD